MNKDSNYFSSNFGISIGPIPREIKEEDTKHKILEDVDIEKKYSQHSHIGQDEAHKYVFHQ
jgi:hypothetical protein